MSSIEATIYSASDSVIKRFTLKSPGDLHFHHEMFNGTRHFDLSPQLAELQEQCLSENRQKYSLFCSYVKFGETQQERADFSVLIQRLD